MTDFVPPVEPETMKLKKCAKRFEGTYKQVPKVEWTELLVNHFGNPDWATLYPIAEGSERVDADGLTWGTPVGLLSPRMACKLFHDGVYILKQAEDKTKFMQDRIPENCHKQFKKKQWRKQFYEACRRICCRLSIGLGFKPNCVAEDVFIHAILNMSFELGWNRIKEYTEGLPLTERDRDFARIHKLAANEEVLSITKGGDAPAPKAKTGSKDGKTFALDLKVADCKQWFRCYEPKLSTMFDHVVEIGADDTDNWSVSTGSTASTASGTSPSRSGKERSESMGSQVSDLADEPNTLSLPSIMEENKGLGGQKLSASNLAALAESLGNSK